MRRAKSIDELYGEVRDFDYVITNDAALATALNARIDVCKIDGFAYTPKTIAGIVETSVLNGNSLGGLETVEEIENQTGFDFKYIHSEVSNIKDIRRYTADVKAYLPSKNSKTVFDVFDSLPTSVKVMGLFEPSVYRTFMTGRKIAVIGIDLFDDLDKHFIPAEYTEIDPFTDGTFEIETVNAIGNDRQIAGSVVDLITEENCTDTAIVLDTGGSVSDAIRSALYRKGIPFKNDLDVKDLAQVRDFIQFVGLALDYKTVRVGDVRELFSVYQTGTNKNEGEELTPQMDNYLLCRVPFRKKAETVTARLIGTMKNIAYCTFGFASDMLFGNMPQKSSVEMVLKSLKLIDKPVTPKLLNRLSYAVNNIDELKHNDQVPENERKGVLLVDCKNSVYIDRSLVIFVGMDESWEVTAPGKDYVDKDKLSEDNAFRLSILLQQGTFRIYAVKPVTNGKQTVPCPAFQTICGLNGETKEIKSFADICNGYVLGSWFGENGTVRKSTAPAEQKTEKTDWQFSKSSYNNYSDCPLKFMFSKLVSSEDSDKTVFGNCVHDFAEFYFCYPESVKKKGLEHYVTELNEHYAGMSNSCEKNLDISKIRVYLSNVVRYIDRIRPQEVPLDRKMSEERPNPFIEAEGLEYSSSFTESTQNNEDEPVFAKFDVCFDSFISDYKTGKPKTAKEIVKGFTWRGKKLSEFQALIYLYSLGLRTEARPCTFNLFYIGENDIASVSEDFDVMDNVVTVKYSADTFAYLAFGPDGILLRSIAGIKTYREIADNWHTVSPVLLEYSQYGNYDSDSCANALMNAMNLKNTKTNRGMVCKFLESKVGRLTESPYLIDDGSVIIPRDSMERFVNHVKDDLITAERERSMPIYDLRKGNLTCKSCGYRKICLKANIEDEEEAE